jgi:hypothetical protein
MKTKSLSICLSVGFLVLLSYPALADWEETFDNGTLDLSTWIFEEYPDFPGTPTFSATLVQEAGSDYYLSMKDLLGAGSGGSAIGMAMGDPNDIQTDVRVGATVNVLGGASWGHHLLGARTSYFINPNPPGYVVDGYALHIDWEQGPANLVFEVEKVVQNSNIMNITTYAVVPGLDHERSYYAELDVVGAGPAYITATLYESKGGPEVLRLPTLVDTDDQDPWEDDGLPTFAYQVFTEGTSGMGAINEDEEPIKGYTTFFDDVSSISNGPAAVGLYPPNDATGVSWDADLEWVEAAFATGRELWFGKAGDMKKVSPNPAGTSYDPDTLLAGQTYEWRVDEIGSSVPGHVYSFTTIDCIVVEDFESYPDATSLKVNWDPNFGGSGNIFVETGNVYEGSQAMRLEYNNDSSPFYKEVTRKFDTPQDWLTDNIVALTLVFRGEDTNAQQPLYVRIEDNNCSSHEVTHDHNYAVQTEAYREWDIELGEFTNNGVDLAQVKKLTIGVGDKTSSPGQGSANNIYIDYIRLYQPRCLNPDNHDLRGDANGDCKIDLYDLAILANGWLKEGLVNIP